jgi:hypothetical protein
MSKQFIRLVLALFAASFFSGCGSSGSSAPPPSGGLTLLPADGQVTVSWNDDSGVQYDLWYGPISDATQCQSTTGNRPIGCQLLTHIRSPYVVNGLINGVTYSFVMNGRRNNGPAGDNTAVVPATPALAGGSWSAGTTLGGTDMHGITFGTNITSQVRYYVAVGNAGAIYNSTDGASWTAVTPPTSNNLNAALYAQSNFIAAGASGGVFHSADALTWTAATSNTSQTLNALGSNAGLLKCYGVLVGTVTSVDYFTNSSCGFTGSKANNASLSVAVGEAGTIIYSSNAGVTWTVATSPTTGSLRGVAYSIGAAKWIAVGAGGVLVSSSNGVDWTTVTSPTTADLNGVAVLPTTNSATLVTTYTFVAVGAGGTVLTSGDGVTWASQTVTPAVDLHAVTGWSQFVAVGAGGSAYSSPDGTTWTPVSSGTASTLYGVLGEFGQYSAVGQAGASIYSR